MQQAGVQSEDPWRKWQPFPTVLQKTRGKAFLAGYEKSHGRKELNLTEHKLQECLDTENPTAQIAQLPFRVLGKVGDIRPNLLGLEIGRS